VIAIRVERLTLRSRQHFCNRHFMLLPAPWVDRTPEAAFATDFMLYKFKYTLRRLAVPQVLHAYFTKLKPVQWTINHRARRGPTQQRPRQTGGYDYGLSAQSSIFMEPIFVASIAGEPPCYTPNDEHDGSVDACVDSFAQDESYRSMPGKHRDALHQDSGTQFVG
jgi:hypothetical protein